MKKGKRILAMGKEIKAMIRSDFTPGIPMGHIALAISANHLRNYRPICKNSLIETNLSIGLWPNVISICA